MKPKKSKPRIKSAKIAGRKISEPSGIQHFLQTWATESGMDPETLKKALIKSDYQPTAGELIPFKAVRKALYGEMYEEELRGERLRNNALERKQRIADGILVEWEMVEKAINDRILMPLTAALDAAPDGVSREWIEKVVKPAMRMKLK